MPLGHEEVYLLLRHLRLRNLHLRHHQRVYARRTGCIGKAGPASCVQADGKMRPKNTVAPLSRQRKTTSRQRRLLVPHACDTPHSSQDFYTWYVYAQVHFFCTLATVSSIAAGLFLVLSAAGHAGGRGEHYGACLGPGRAP